MLSFLPALLVLAVCNGCESFKQKDSGEYSCDVECTECKHVRVKCELEVDESVQEKSVESPVGD